MSDAASCTLSDHPRMHELQHAASRHLVDLQHRQRIVERQLLLLGERLSLRGDETFPTASLIKVPILVTLYDLAEQKQLSLDDPLTVLKIDQVPGSGVLQFMHPGMSLSVHDAASLMIVLSDNTATNLLLDRIAIRRVWDKDGVARPPAHQGPLEDVPAPHERRDGQLGQIRAGREHAERDGAPVRALARREKP